MAVRKMNGACMIGDFAKTLGTGRTRFFRKLKEDGVLMANRLPISTVHRPWLVRGNRAGSLHGQQRERASCFYHDGDWRRSDLVREKISRFFQV